MAFSPIDLGKMAALGDAECISRWAAELAKRNNAETNSYMEFVTSYDELNSFARKVESELEQKKKELLYIQHTGNNLQLGNGRGIEDDSHFSYPKHDSSMSPATEVKRLKQKVHEMQEALRWDSERNTSQAPANANDISQRLKESQNSLHFKTKALESAGETIEKITKELQVKQKEVDTFRSEVLRLREENKRLVAENQQVKTENGQLIQRIMDEKAKMAAEVNDMNQLYEKVRDNAGLLGKARSKSFSIDQQRSRRGNTSNRNSPSTAHGTSIGGQSRGNISLASIAPSTAVHSVCAHEGAEAYSVVYSKDGRCLCTCGSDGLIKVWSSNSLQKPVGLLRGSDSSPIIDIDWVGSSIIGGSTDTAARVWDTRTGRVRHTLKGHRGKVMCVKLSIDGKYGISGSSDRTIKVWDMKTGYVIRTIQCSSVCNSIDLGPDQVTLASAHQDGAIRVWDIRNGNRSHEISDLHKLPVSHVEFSSISSSMNAGILLTMCRDNKLRLFNTLSFENTMQMADRGFRVSANWSSSCISPDSNLCAAGSGTGTVHVWSTNSGKMLRQLQKHGSAVYGCAWRPDGTQIATVDKRGYCVLWE